MKRALSEPHPLAKSKQYQSKDLPSNKQIITVLEQSAENEKIWLSLLIMSGRRGVDISRLKWRNVQMFENEMTCMLERDKASKGVPVSFVCKWQDFDVPGFNFEPIKNLLINNKNKKAREDYVVDMNEVGSKPRQQQFILFKQKISRRSKFCVHGLRRRRAVIELMAGKKEDQVSSKIGWKSKRSLFTYVSLSSDQIKNFENYTAFLNFMNNQHSNQA